MRKFYRKVSTLWKDDDDEPPLRQERSSSAKRKDSRPTRETTTTRTPNNGRSGDGDNIKVHLIWTSPVTPIYLDIIAIHGHGGHWSNSWTHPDTGCNWIRDICPVTTTERGMPSRIFSVSYTKDDEDQLGLIGVVRRILEEIGKVRQSIQPLHPGIFWTVHSFGGVVLKSLLAGKFEPGLEKEQEDLRTFTTAMFLFGVPRHGMGWKNIVRAMKQKDNGEISEEIDRLRREVDWIRDTDEAYELVRASGPYMVRYFLEADTVKDAGSTSTGSTTEGNKVEENGDMITRMNKTHGGLIKFTGRDDPEWEKMEFF